MSPEFIMSIPQIPTFRNSLKGILRLSNMNLLKMTLFFLTATIFLPTREILFLQANLQRINIPL